MEDIIQVWASKFSTYISIASGWEPLSQLECLIQLLKALHYFTT